MVTKVENKIGYNSACIRDIANVLASNRVFCQKQWTKSDNGCLMTLKYLYSLCIITILWILRTMLLQPTSKDNRWHWVNSWKTCIHRYASPCTYRLRYSDMLLCDLALILSYLDVADDAIENVIAQAIEFLSACYLLFLVWQRQMQTSVSTLQTGRFWVTLMPHPGRVVRFQVLLFIHVVDDVLVVSSSSSKVKLLWSSWHLFHLSSVQCDRTGKDAVLGQ